ncbi:MAG: DUF2817 domain-containing protein [Chloroflexi bacterium]|nr:DUF2817 domain-containing protein [Chloroflexota bacterium]
MSQTLGKLLLVVGVLIVGSVGLWRWILFPAHVSHPVPDPRRETLQTAWCGPGSSQGPFFPDTYDAYLEHLQARFPEIRARWPKATWRSVPLYPEEDLDLVWIEARAAQPARALVLTAGVHGIEGYGGAAMIDIFLSHFLDTLDPQNTSLYIIPVVNPWGMRHFRRVNKANVDLNRNFVPSESELSHRWNPDYEKLYPFLNPTRPVAWGDRYLFSLRVTRVMIEQGPETLRVAGFSGQYRFPEGVAFGGQKWQPETHAMMDLLTEIRRRHSRTLLLDMHTGYGERGQLLMIFPAQENRSEDTLRDLFAYPHLAKISTRALYPIRGDMTSWFVQGDGKEDMGITFEVGTYGKKVTAQLRSLRALVVENQFYHHGATHPAVAQWVAEEYCGLFYPDDPAWREALTQQTRAAFHSVLPWLQGE